jgi:hypothetical protein
MDFSDSRKFAPGTHHGILLLRLHSPNQAALVSRVTELFESEEIETWTCCFVVATEQKLQVLHQ